jgi:hypothetical protein
MSPLSHLFEVDSWTSSQECVRFFWIFFWYLEVLFVPLTVLCASAINFNGFPGVEVLTTEKSSFKASNALVQGTYHIIGTFPYHHLFLTCLKFGIGLI